MTVKNIQILTFAFGGRVLKYVGTKKTILNQLICNVEYVA